MKTNIIVTAAIALVAGYVAGSLIGLPATKGNASGNISKVSKYNKVEMTPTLSAYQEKIMNDSLEMQKAALTLTLLTSRTEEFSSLVELAQEASKGISELEIPVARLKDVQHTSQNASKAGQAALESFNDLISGNPGQKAAQYEQTSQNLTLAYLMTDRQVRHGKDFVLAVDEFLKNNDPEKYQQLAAARDLWARYCAGSAILNGDQTEKEYWSGTNSILDSKTLCNQIEESTLNNLKPMLAFEGDIMFGVQERGDDDDEEDYDDSDPGDGDAFNLNPSVINLNFEDLGNVSFQEIGNINLQGLDNIQHCLEAVSFEEMSNFEQFNDIQTTLNDQFATTLNLDIPM